MRLISHLSQRVLSSYNTENKRIPVVSTFYVIHQVWAFAHDLEYSMIPVRRTRSYPAGRRVLTVDLRSYQQV